MNNHTPPDRSDIKFVASGKTDIGKKRKQNQDSMGVFDGFSLYCVADGMGGHRGGQVASSLAIATTREYYENNGYKLEATRILREAADLANISLLKRAMHEEDLQGMGTTLTMLQFKGPTAYIGHVGDSRCYLIRPDGIWQLTKDHSLVQEKFYAGLITRDQIRTDKMKNVITRSLGIEHAFGIDLYQYNYQKGDLFLICSDGLTGSLSDQEIWDIVRMNYLDAPSREELDPKVLLDRTCDDLIRKANEQSGEDNITAVLVACAGS